MSITLDYARSLLRNRFAYMMLADGSMTIDGWIRKMKSRDGWMTEEDMAYHLYEQVCAHRWSDDYESKLLHGFSEPALRKELAGIFRSTREGYNELYQKKNLPYVVTGSPIRKYGSPIEPLKGYTNA